MNTQKLLAAALAGLCLSSLPFVAPVAAKDLASQWNDTYSSPSAADRQVGLNQATAQWLIQNNRMGTVAVTNIGEMNSTTTSTYNGPVEQNTSNSTNAVDISSTNSSVAGPVDGSTITITHSTSQDTKSANQSASSTTVTNKP